MQSKLPLKRWASYVLLAALSASPALAQSDSGTVNGTVEDATGAVIPGTSVKLTNVDTGAVKTVQSGADGNFLFPSQPRGNYKVEASHDGFATVIQRFTLQVSQNQTLDLKLNAGAATTEVQVTDAAPIIDLADSTIGEVVAGRQVTELPLNGRNFTQLALLTPGVTRGNYGNAASGQAGNVETFRNSQSGGGSLTSNGLRPQANNFILDGVDNNESLVNTLDFFPNIEGTEEFKVNTSTAPAEFGRAGGSVVQSSIKSGTNQIHGSAFEFARSSLFDASPNYTFLGAAPTPALPFKRNTFGGSVGFPIFKDKLFLFGDYQGLRDAYPLNPEIITVPTAQFRQGNFAQLLGTGLTQTPTQGPGSTLKTGPSGAIYDPLTGLPFAGNIIPANRLNPVAVNYLNAFPLPNIPGTGNGTENNYRTIRNNITKNNTFDTRLDGNLGRNDRAFFRFIYDNSNFTRTSQLPNLPAGFASGSNYVHARGYALGETHTFSPNIINEFRAGYNRYTIANVPVFSGVPVAANLGIVNANRTAQLGGGALIGGNGSQLSYTGDYGTYVVPENTYQFNDAVTILRGRHSFKFGGNGIRRDVAFFRPIAGKGFFQLNNGDFTGFDTSELLVGFADNYAIGAQTGLFDTRNYEVGAFAQDDWKASQRLTLNLGVRWDLLTFPFEVENRQAALNPVTGTIDLAGVNGVPQSIINNNFRNFAPRVGFAYDLYGKGRSVLRGGYGIFYFLDRGGIDNQLGQQVPFGGSVSYAAAQGYRTTLSGAAPAGSNSNANATGSLPLPGYPGFNPNVPPAGINIIAVNRTEKTPNVQQYDLQLQQQFGDKIQATLGYVGNKSTHLATGFNDNTNPQGQSNTAAVAYPNLGQVILNQTSGVSNYNSFQAQLNYRLRQGFTLTSSYTWAHNRDNTDGYLGFFAVSPLNVYNTRANRGNSSLDQRNVFVASALYDLPFGHGHAFGDHWGRGLELAAGGWQLNTIVQTETGSPYTILINQYGGTFSQRANAVGPVRTTHSIANPFLTGSFTIPAAGTEGNTGRNQFYGPGIAEGDVSVFKTLHVTERFGTELRGEIFNVTNTPQFTSPDANLQDAVNTNGVYTTGPQSSFGRVLATRTASERQIQLAVRFLF